MPKIIYIVPDTPYEYLIGRIIANPQVLGIARHDASVYRIPEKDSGVRKFAHEKARNERKRGADREDYALAILDFHGSGASTNAASCEAEIELNLSRVTFSGSCKAICIDPEIEAILLVAPDSVATCLSLTITELNTYLGEARRKHPNDLERQVNHVLKAASRKNNDRYELRDVIDGIPLTELLAHPGFEALVSQLRLWFP